MPKFTIDVAMDIRAYGTATIEAETAEEAFAGLTAEIVAETFEPHGHGSDDYDHEHPQDIWLQGVWQDDDGNEGDGMHRDVPNGPWIKPEKLSHVTAYALAIDGYNSGTEVHVFSTEAERDTYIWENCLDCPDDLDIDEFRAKFDNDWSEAMVNHTQEYCTWQTEDVCLPVPVTPASDRAALAEKLRDGADADIWVDVEEHGEDGHLMRVAEEARQAMRDAASVLTEDTTPAGPVTEPQPVLIDADDQPSNNERAAWAAAAVEAHCDETGSEFEEGFNDLLVNLHHLADREGWNASKAYRGSFLIYGEESEEQPKASAPASHVLPASS